MPLRFPPRREPRVLALVRSRDGFHYATADPWELRCAGLVACHGRALSASVARLVRREKPTLLVTGSPSLRVPVRRAARQHGIGVAVGDLPKLRRDVARQMYPELPMRAPTRDLDRVATLAISAVLYAETPPRRYAPTRHRPPEHAA